MNAAIAPDFLLHCPNPHCLQHNPGDREYCQVCNTRLLRRFLRVVGSLDEPPQPNQLLAGRYRWLGNGDDRIVLDTQPGQPPALMEEVPDPLLPYLRLMPQRFAVPQIYGFPKAKDARIFFLEDVPIYAHTVGSTTTPAQGGEAGTLMPRLRDVWGGSHPQRQLGWLWQIASLWMPLQQHKVAASLLNPDFLRVDGPGVRLLELALKPNTPTLEQLGKSWEELLPMTHPHIRPFLQGLVDQLKNRELRDPHPLTQILEQALTLSSQGRDCRITLTTQTDAGPSRQNNEDACFPPSQQQVMVSPGGQSLAVVCDGLGGHEGGEVASAMAVGIFNSQLSSHGPALESPFQAIQGAITKANDAISQRNNDEHRQERRRMGTTLVSALTLDTFTYIFHVGDSRAYWISPRGCRQLTVDDDLASRHVALGFGLYRSVLQSPTSGALVQALGMAASANLMANIQPFFVDEDGLMLLCSDGLSDNDLVDYLWDSLLLPVVTEGRDLQEACGQVVQMANTANGHDNVTVALVHYQITAPPLPSTADLLALLTSADIAPSEPLTEPMQGRGLGHEPENDEDTTHLKYGPAIDPPAPTQPSAVTTGLSAPPERSIRPSPVVIAWALMVVTIVAALVGSWLWSPSFNLNNNGTDSNPSPLTPTPEPSPGESLMNPNPELTPTGTPETGTLENPSEPVVPPN